MWTKCINFLVGLVTPKTLDERVERIQQAVVGSCGYLPTAATVASILSAGKLPFVSTAVAGAICVAVTAHNARKFYGIHDYVPTVYGVEIEGEWVGHD